MAIFPMSWSMAARRSSSIAVSPRPSALPDGNGELGDVVGVRVEVGLALVERLEQHLVRLVACRPLAALLDVQPLVGLAQRADPLARMLGEEDRAERARHREALALLAESGERVVEQPARERRVGRRQEAELVAAEAIAAAVAGVAAASFPPSRASSASPAGWPKASLYPLNPSRSKIARSHGSSIVASPSCRRGR